MVQTEFKLSLKKHVVTEYMKSRWFKFFTGGHFTDTRNGKIGYQIQWTSDNGTPMADSYRIVETY